MTLSLAITFAGLGSPVLADDDGTFQCGVRLYNSGKYVNAVKYFEAARKEAPYDARIVYYEGLTHHKMGQLAAARSCYQQVVDKFPDSDAAELAKQGLGTIDFGSGYDRPGGTLAKLDHLRMDIVPAEATISCRELDGKPVVDATVDGRKISFLVDASAQNTTIGIDLVRAYSLNDVPLNGKTAKPLTKTSSAPAVAPTPAESKTLVEPKPPDSKSTTEGKAPTETKTTTETKTSASAEKTTTEVKAGAESKGSVSDTATKTATPDQKAPTDLKAATDQKTTTDQKAATDQKAPAPKLSDSAVVLYDVILGPVQRPGFPVFISTAKPKTAVLGKDFLGPYKVTFNATAKTLGLVRDHAYDNPFNVGMNLFGKGKYAQAVPLLKRASENRPRDPRALYCYAVALQRAGSIESAKLAYRQVNMRFPNSEANFYAVAALGAIDPGYMREMKAIRVDSQGKLIGDKKISVPYFDAPYAIENGNMKVTVKVDNIPVEMYVDLRKSEFEFSSQSLSAISPDYLNDLVEVSRTTDENTNLMWTVVTKKGWLKHVSIGNAEKLHVPMLVIDQGALKWQAAWNGVSPRPILPIMVFSDWRAQVMDDKKVIRFTRLQSSLPQ